MAIRIMAAASTLVEYTADITAVDTTVAPEVTADATAVRTVAEVMPAVVEVASLAAVVATAVDTGEQQRSSVIDKGRSGRAIPGWAVFFI